MSVAALPSHGATARPKSKEVRMAWKAPKIVEVSVGMEINMYACAARK
jgi:coenzyme PQQ precursor peptide PqqA